MKWIILSLIFLVSCNNIVNDCKETTTQFVVIDPSQVGTCFNPKWDNTRTILLGFSKVLSTSSMGYYIGHYNKRFTYKTDETVFVETATSTHRRDLTDWFGGYERMDECP